MSGKAGFSDNEPGNAHGFAPWEGINTAFSWLTILPFPGAATFDRTTGARAMAALPLVGVFLGVCTYALAMVADALSISPLLTAVLIVVLWETLTRMMHLDGLADVGDALGSFQSGEQAQKILADRYTGALGMGTVLLTLLTQVAAIHALLTTPYCRRAARHWTLRRYDHVRTRVHSLLPHRFWRLGHRHDPLVVDWRVGVDTGSCAVLRGVDTRHYCPGGNASVQPARCGAFSAAFRRT